MSVRVYIKDVGEVRDVYRRELGSVWQLEDGIEKWIRRDLGVELC